MTKICNFQRDYWNHTISVALWAYRTTCKKLTGQTPFLLVYGQEVIMLMEYIVPTLRIGVIVDITDVGAVKEILSQLIHL